MNRNQKHAKNRRKAAQRRLRAEESSPVTVSMTVTTDAAEFFARAARNGTVVEAFGDAATLDSMKHLHGNVPVIRNGEVFVKSPQSKQQRDTIARFKQCAEALLRAAESAVALHHLRPADTEAQLDEWMLVEDLCDVTAVQARNLQTLLQHQGQELTLCDHCDLYHCPGDDGHEADHEHSHEPLAS